MQRKAGSGLEPSIWEQMKDWLMGEDHSITIRHGGKHWYALLRDEDDETFDGIGDTAEAAAANAWATLQGRVAIFRAPDF